MSDEVKRTPITIPGSSAVVLVPDEQLGARLAQGWKRVKGKRAADTGAIPTQPPSSTTPTNR